MRILLSKVETIPWKCKGFCGFEEMMKRLEAPKPDERFFKRKSFLQRMRTTNEAEQGENLKKFTKWPKKIEQQNTRRWWTILQKIDWNTEVRNGIRKKCDWDCMEKQ